MVSSEELIFSSSSSRCSSYQVQSAVQSHFVNNLEVQKINLNADTTFESAMATSTLTKEVPQKYKKKLPRLDERQSPELISIKDNRKKNPYIEKETKRELSNSLNLDSIERRKTRSNELIGNTYSFHDFDRDDDGNSLESIAMVDNQDKYFDYYNQSHKHL